MQLAKGQQPPPWKEKHWSTSHHCCFWQAGGRLVCNGWYHILVTFGKALLELEVPILIFSVSPHPLAFPPKPRHSGCQQPGWESSRMARKPRQKQISCSSGLLNTLSLR